MTDDISSIHSLLEQAGRDAGQPGEKPPGEKPSTPPPDPEVLRAQVAAFRERVLASRQVRRLVQKHRKRGVYAVRPWQWAAMAVLVPVTVASVLFGVYRFSQATRAQIAMGRALEAARKGEAETADAEAARALSFGFNPAIAHERLGLAYAEAGLLERAIEALDRSCQITLWQDPYPILQGVRVILDLGHPREAIERLQKSKSVAEFLPDYYLLMGRARIRLGEVDDAKEALSQALRLDPNLLSARYYQYDIATQRGEAGPAHLHEGVLLAQTPRMDEEPEVLLGLARLYMENDRSRDARNLLDKVLARAQRDVLPEIYYTRGLLGLLEKRPDEAMSDLGEAVRLRPRNPDFLTRYAEVLYLFGRTEEALVALSRALDAAPLHARARYDLGWILWADMGDLAGAHPNFEAARAQRTAFPHLPYALAASRYGIRDYDGAESALVEMPPHLAETKELRFLRGILSLREGDYKRAQEDFEALLAGGKKEARILSNLGLAREMQGDTAGAGRLYWQALAASPSREAVDPIAERNLQRILSGRYGGPLDGRIHEEIEPRPASFIQ